MMKSMMSCKCVFGTCISNHSRFGGREKVGGFGFNPQNFCFKREK